MPIIVNLDVMLARRKMRSKELAERIGITEQNVSQPFSCFLGPPGEGLKIMTRGLRAPPR